MSELTEQMPKNMNVSAPKTNPKFWDKASAKYSKSPVSDPAAYAHTLDRTRFYLKPDDHMLELGCGTGTTALTLSDQVRHITATDISQNMLDIADRKKHEQGINNVDFVQKSVEDLPFGETYDVLFASSLLHLLTDLEDGLARIRQSIEPDGLFISKTVCLKKQNPIFPILIPIMRFFGLAPYVNFITGDELEIAVKQAGFEIIESGDHNAKPACRFIVARAI
jgi:ubiquinone/menaquinone biosynthesis C-methylase UbiE